MENKNARLALATLFLNMAVAAHQEPLQPGLGEAFQQLAALYAEVFESVSESFPDEALYRFLVGLGTLVTVRGLAGGRSFPQEALLGWGRGVRDGAGGYLFHAYPCSQDH